MTVSNSDYFYMLPLQQVIFDKDGTGPLAAGIVSFYSDPAFSIPKDVYEQSNAAPYGFVDIGSVLVLSGIGSFIDGSGENFVPMLYPWELSPSDSAAPGAFEPYFITVDSAGLVRQFTVTNWPPNSFAGANTGALTTSVTQNIMTNPQFAEVLFTPPAAGGGTVFTVSGASAVLQIAPAWYVKTTGSGTVTVTQVSNSVQTPSEAPYYLEVVTAGLSAFMLYQRIDMSPRLLYGSAVSAYFEAATPNNTEILLTLNYAPSDGGTLQQLAQGTTTNNLAFTAISTQTSPVILDSTPFNTDNASGYIDIQLVPGTVNCSLELTSFQVVGVPETAPLPTLPAFIQVSTPQQISQLYWYDKPHLFYKPIPSWLVGWDFPLNPCQPLGNAAAPVSTGANGSYYIADQTIIFQTVDSSFTLAQTQRGFNLTAAQDTSFAVIQYLPGNVALDLLKDRLSVALSTDTTQTSLNGEVNLYWTSNAAVPVLPLSVISGITITAGSPVNTVTSGWTAIPRALGPATFTATPSSGSSLAPSVAGPFVFSGWDPTGVDTLAATYVAIVISYATLSATKRAILQYCSLNSGDIPTRPSPQTPDEVLRECQYYYEKSFPASVVPAQAVGLNSGESYDWLTAGISGPIVRYSVPKRISAAPITFYNPVSSNAFIYNISTPGALFTTTVVYANTNSINGFVIQGNQTGGATGDLLGVNWTADSRLGIV